MTLPDRLRSFNRRVNNAIQLFRHQPWRLTLTKRDPTRRRFVSRGAPGYPSAP